MTAVRNQCGLRTAVALAQLDLHHAQRILRPLQLIALHATDMIRHHSAFCPVLDFVLLQCLWDLGLCSLLCASA